MTDIFIKVIEMSATASIVIGVVMLLRLALKKAPKIFSYALWAAALFRLLCPISFELPSAPIPNVEIPYSAAVGERNAEGLFITHTDTEIAPAPDNYAPQTEMTEQTAAVPVKEPAPVMETPAKRQINFIALASYIWALAVTAMALRGVVSWIKLSHSLSSAQKMGDKVYVSAAISDPFIMGIIRPRIYLPTGLSCIESDLIIRHEKSHMHRGDHIAKLIMYAALCIHCFNPLVWVMFRLFERDMEMSCDEKVTADMTREQKADYSQTLLKISSKPAAAFTACFGENGTKQRVKNVLSFKKPAVWVVIVLTLAAVVISVVLCVSRENESSSIPTDAVDNIDIVDNDDTFTSEKLKEFFSLGVNPNSIGLSIKNSEGLTFSEPFVIPFYNTAENSFSVVPYVWSSAVFQDDKLTALAMFSYQSGQTTLKYLISLPSEFSDNISSGEKYSIFLVNADSTNGWDNGELMYAVNSNGNSILLKDERYDERSELNEAYPDFNAVCEYNCVSANMEEAVTVEELTVFPSSPELTPALGMNGVLAYMRREDYYGEHNDEYERHSEAVTDEEKNKLYREQFYPQYGETIEQCTFICEYFLVPLYDESGENVVDYFRIDSGVTPILPEDDEYNDWTDTIKLIPLTEEHQRTVDISSASPDVIYSDSRNCLFDDGTGGLYLYNFENRELLLAVDFLASMELVNSGIAIEENQYGGASIGSSWTTFTDKPIYFSFETKGKEKRGGAFNGRSYRLDVINSKLSISGTSGSLYEAAVTEPIDPAEQPDAISSSLAMINKRDFVYMVNSGTDEGHLPMIRLARNINGNVEYFDPFEKALIPQERKAPEEWGLSFTAEAAGNTGVNLKLSCTCERELTTGSYFIIQKREVYGWSEPKYCATYYLNVHCWTGEAIIIPNDSERVITEDWSGIYGELSYGEYRIGKYFSMGNDRERLVYAYFSIS